MKNSSNSRIAFGCHTVTDAPYAEEVTDSTLWPSESATLNSMQTLIEIHNRGYGGLKIEGSRLNPSETLLSRCVNLSSPEGHLALFVMGLAEHGIALPKDQALGLLEKIYQSEGLPPPTPRPLIEQVYLSTIER